jgi:hypothetical protein
VPVYYPGINIGGSSFGGPGFFWNQQPQGEAFNVKVSHQAGSHYLKAGLEHRRSYGPVYVSNTSNFYFNSALTANTFVSPDTLHLGDPFATFLLGALDGTSEMVGGPTPDPHTEFWGMYFQDNCKVTRNLTINMGLRNEYESAWHDPSHQLSVGLDLNAPVPEMQANPPQIPAQALALVGSGYYKYNGLWQFTSGSHPGMWDAPAIALAPRLGAAYRVNDQTSVRAGYARYVTPTEYNFTAAPFAGFEDVNFLEPPFFGFTGYQFTAPLLQGQPQQTFSNPYPASNPLLPIVGKGYGTNLGRGGQNLLWYPKNFQKAYNDRINVTVERQLPARFVASFTWFTNFGQQHYTKALNNINPQLEVQNQNALNVNVANPFYNYLTPTLFPGPLRNQQTVSLASLLVPYPQYGPLYQVGVCCSGERYNSLETRIQRAYANGFNFLFSYVYIRERAEINSFNDLTVYQNSFQWQNSNQPHHRLNFAGTYELPFGQGKPFLHALPRVVDAVVGGWKVTPFAQLISGDFPQFGNAVVSGNPCISNPTPAHWFNTAVFQAVPANTYVLRSNPLQYGCLRGPSFFVMDASLVKNFRLYERFHAEIKMTAYNATNHLNRGDPDTNPLSSTFGQALYQGSPGGNFGSQGGGYGNQSGRQVELGVKIIF